MKRKSHYIQKLVSRNIDQSPQNDKVSEFVETKGLIDNLRRVDLENIRRFTSFDTMHFEGMVTLGNFRKYL